MLNTITTWVHSLTILDKSILVAVLFLHLIISMMGIFFYTIFSLIGTIAHELMHWLVVFVLGAHPTFPNLIPEKTSTGWRLGSVSCSTSLLKNIPIALAPFALAPIALWWAATYMHAAKGWWYVIHAWIAGTLMMSSLPSSQDWKIAAPSIIVFAMAGWAVLHFY